MGGLFEGIRTKDRLSVTDGWRNFVTYQAIAVKPVNSCKLNRNYALNNKTYKLEKQVPILCNKLLIEKRKL
jgi:hypothetical protein